jgi:beta-lactamase superfamily II metal-dependent hydrolase
MEPTFTVTMLDVGWGDSIFLHSIDSNDQHHFALIDSNDTKYLQSSRIFLRKFFRHHQHYEGKLSKPFFDFVLLTHNHADHRSGLENIMREFGTKYFWYPHSKRTPALGRILDFAVRETEKYVGSIEDHEPIKYLGCIEDHEAMEVGKPLPKFGDVEMKILWPPEGFDYENATPNNTSVVLSMKLGKWSVVLTGDAEEQVWDNIASNIPTNTRFFKVPHHGSVNGTFDNNGKAKWYERCSRYSRLGISCNIYGNFVFPNPSVTQMFDDDNRKYFRTDEHYHITFNTDGNKYNMKYSHFKYR